MRMTSVRLPTTHRSRPACLRATGLVVFGLLLALPAGAAEGVKVDVVVDGLPADMKRNVLGSMMLSASAQEGRMSEGEARRLAGRAPREIAQALQPFGYYRPVIRDELDTTGDPWKARYVVETGPPVLLTGVEVTVTGPGADLPRFRELIRGFSLKPGERFQHAPYEAFKTGLDRAAAQNGYLDARYITRRITVDPAADTARIQVHLETGERYRFGPVRFHQDILDDAFVNSFVTFQAGAPYNADSLIAMQRALGSSPYFSRVEVEPRRSEAKDLVVPIDVRLEPAKGLRWTLGGGYGTDTGLEGSAALEFRRLNRMGHRANIDLTVSERRDYVGVQYQMPRAFGRDQLLTHSVALIDEETDAQRSRGGSIGTALSRSRGAWHESFGLFFQRQQFTVGVDQGRPDLLFPELSWRWLKSDAPIQPRSGNRVAFVLRGASDQVVSDVTFGQLSVQWKGLHGAGPRARVIARAEAGGTRSTDFHALPPANRFFSGGSQSVRAYGYQELGPHDANGEPTGGENLLFGSFEYEYRFFGDWGAAAFYDIGDAIERFGDPLASGAGTGVRWFSPVGMVRLDVAWPIHDPAHGAQVQFTIGPDL
jgi:translocation and assembly module TamA